MRPLRATLMAVDDADTGVRPPSHRPTWWGSVAERLLRFLLFVLGPADIGPLGPPLGLAEKSSTAGTSAVAPDSRPSIMNSGIHITVIPIR
jgi:hypothetical protein